MNVLEELYELAQRTGAEVEFVEEDEFLQSIGGVGNTALLKANYSANSLFLFILLGMIPCRRAN